MSVLRKLAGETAIYGFSYILSRVLHYVLFTWYLTRVFGDARDQYGIYKDLYFYVAILLVILTFRMETAYFRYAKEDRPAVSMMSMSFLAGLSGLFVLLLWVFRSSVAGWLQYDGMTDHLMILGGVLFFDTLSAVPFASLRQQNRPWRFLSLKVGSILLNIIYVLLFIEVLPKLAAQPDANWLSWFNPQDKLLYIFLSNLLASAITFVLLIPIMWKHTWRWDVGFLKKMLRYSWPLVIVAIAGVINQSSSITFQKLVLPGNLKTNLEAGGVYAAAASLAILLNLFTIAFNYAAEPFFFAQKDKADARKIYADVALLFTIAGATIMLCILAYLDVVQLLLGKNFRQGLAVVPVLLLAYLMLGIYYNLSAWYKLADKTLAGAWIAIGGTAITILGNIWLLPKLGVMGSAISALACYTFMCLTSYYQGKIHYPIPYAIGRMLIWIVTALLIYAMMEWLRDLVSEKIGLSLFLNTALIIAFVTLVLVFEKELIQKLKKGS